MIRTRPTLPDARCPFNDNQRCAQEEPELREILPGHWARCHYAGQLNFSAAK
jgi:hypothetical protein